MTPKTSESIVGRFGLFTGQPIEPDIQANLSPAEAPEEPALYRVGRKLRRTIYFDNTFIGIFDDENMAALVVRLLNEDVERSAASMTDHERDFIDDIYRFFDSLFRTGRFAHANDLLGGVKPNRLSTVEMLAYVSITHATKDLLPNRSGFVARVREHLTAFDPARVEACLEGIE